MLMHRHRILSRLEQRANPDPRRVPDRSHEHALVSRECLPRGQLHLRGDAIDDATVDVSLLHDEFLERGELHYRDQLLCVRLHTGFLPAQDGQHI